MPVVTLAAGFVGKHARDDGDQVLLAALSRESRLAWFALLEKGLDFRSFERNARRTAIDHAANLGPVALTPGGEAEKMAERVVGHWGPVSRKR